MKEIRRLFGQRVRALRTARGLSQEGLALKVGVHRTYVGNVERGEKNCSLEFIEKIAVGLETTPTELLAFPQSDQDTAKQRDSVISHIRESPPEVVKFLADLLAELRTVRPKPKKTPKRQR